MGSPFIQHYSPATYDAASQNWDIIQDKDGVLYVGNNKGLLQYDGKKWNLITTTNNATVHALGYFKDVIYVGAENEIGFLQPTSQGDLKYHSLLPYLDSAFHDFNTAWNISVNSEGVYFRTSKYLLRWDGTQFTSTWKPPIKLSRSFIVGEQFYAQLRDGRLLIPSADTFALAPNGGALSTDRILAMFPYETDQVLVVMNQKTATGGNKSKLYRLELKENGAYEPFDSPEVNAFCNEGVVYDQAILKDGNYVLATIGNGIMIFDKEGNVIQELNKNYNLPNDVVICLYTDYVGGLWAGLNNGIAHIEIASPFRFWDDKQGLEGTTQAMIRYQEQLYVGTAQGLFVHNGEQFDAIEGVTEQTWDFLHYKHDDEKLLVANYGGLYEVKNGKGILTTQTSTILTVLQKQDQSELVFAGGSGGLFIIKDEGTSWKLINTINAMPGDIETMCEDEQHNIWLGTNQHQMYRLNFPDNDYSQAPSITTYGEEKGVPNTSFTRAHYLQNQVLLASEKGVFFYNKTTDQFESYQQLGSAFAGSGNSAYSMAEGNDTDIWVFSLQKSDWSGKVYYEEKKPKLLSHPFKRLPKSEINQIFFEVQNDHLWLGTDKLYRFENKEVIKQNTSFNTLIRKVIVNDDSTVFLGNHFRYVSDKITPVKLASKQDESLIAQLPYTENTLTFEYAALSFDQEELNTYSYQLQGHDKIGEWSSWSMDTKKQYTDLFEGTYTFKVKSRNIYGVESSIAAYQFEVLPPLYRTKLAYFMYVLAAILLVFLIVKLNARRIILEKRHLEEEVEKRTEEIQNKNEEIAQQNSTLLVQKNLIEKKNKDTFDSIRYAERILNALHIHPTQLKELIPESFVFFQPKDIVSGDFFWCTKTIEGDIIVATIDCTGHGIPGAFMSVIGQSLLKETVNMYGITEVDEILHSLHAMLTSSLSREKGASIEGMDMTVCKIDLTARTVCFAGAKNPLVYLRNGKMTVIKGDKLPVGGIRPDEERQFTKHTILLDAAPTTFYMFSDGFQDQFGGPKNRKFMPKRFRQLLTDIHQEDFDTQYEKLKEAYNNWKGNEKQLDDIIVLGFQL